MTDPRCTETPREPTIELRLGDYRTALADVARVDAVITDPPYSERTHAGHDSGVRQANDGGERYGHRTKRNAIDYAAWSPGDMADFAARWHDRAGWIVALTDDVSIGTWRDAYESAGRIGFTAVPIVEVGSRVRISGDGPSSWSCYACVSRPKGKAWQSWGTLPGAYVYYGHGDRVIVGGKRLDCMRAIIRDYSRPGDLICDPCAGGATTLIAAHMEGRSAIGAELDPKTYDLAKRRIDAYLAQGTLFTPRSPIQETLIK